MARSRSERAFDQLMASDKSAASDFNVPTDVGSQEDLGGLSPEPTGAAMELAAREEKMKFMSSEQLFGKPGTAGSGGVTAKHQADKIANTQKTSTELFGPPHDPLERTAPN